MEISAIPAAHREWVEMLRHGGATPLSPDSLHAAPNSWVCTPCHVFSVRGADYMQTKAKVPASEESLLQPLAFDHVQGPSQISHIMNHPNSRVRRALDSAIRDGPPQHQPFVWCFNIQQANKLAHYNVIYYFVSFRSAPEGSLMQRFLDGDDDFRNSRLKVLSHFPDAPGLIRRLIGKKWPACLVAKFLKCVYIRKKHYIEVDMDATSSVVVRTATNLAYGLIPLVVSDMAFVLEGTHPNELPERILGAIRAVRLQPSSAVHMDMSDVQVIKAKDERGDCKQEVYASGEQPLSV